METTTVPQKPLIEGKTKKIFEIENDPTRVRIFTKDDITAGNGKKHEVLPGKGALATRTTSNVFRLLKECGIPVAFSEQTGPDTFTAPKCTMLLYEVVVRREAHGSYLKRYPNMSTGHLFPGLLLEFFLKTSQNKWAGRDLPEDDPYMVITNEVIYLHVPNIPFNKKDPFLTVNVDEVFTQKNEHELLNEMGRLAKQAFLVLEKAWQIQGRKLVDFKVEFGLDTEGKLLLADVIDNDSWRVLENGYYIDKQVFRDGGELNEVLEKYTRVAAMTDSFHIPKQQVIVWAGSEKDDTAPLTDAISKMTGARLSQKKVACSVHKQPALSLQKLYNLLQETPNSVIIAFIGMSNGAGPVLSAATSAPVITIPANFKDFPEDVFSALRTPSDVPVATIVSPGNAVLMALNILSMNNPYLYMVLNERICNRAVNVVSIE